MRGCGFQGKGGGGGYVGGERVGRPPECRGIYLVFLCPLVGRSSELNRGVVCCGCTLIILVVFCSLREEDARKRVFVVYVVIISAQPCFSRAYVGRLLI